MLKDGKALDEVGIPGRGGLERPVRSLAGCALGHQQGATRLPGFFFLFSFGLANSSFPDPSAKVPHRDGVRPKWRDLGM